MEDEAEASLGVAAHEAATVARVLHSDSDSDSDYNGDGQNKQPPTPSTATRTSPRNHENSDSVMQLDAETLAELAEDGEIVFIGNFTPQELAREWLRQQRVTAAAQRQRALEEEARSARRKARLAKGAPALVPIKAEERSNIFFKIGGKVVVYVAPGTLCPISRELLTNRNDLCCALPCGHLYGKKEYEELMLRGDGHCALHQDQKIELGIECVAHNFDGDEEAGKQAAGEGKSPEDPIHFV